MTAIAHHSAHTPVRPARRRSPALTTSAVGYSVAWIVGLLLVSVSTKVTTSGPELVRMLAPHQVAAAAQYVVTEGVTALALAAVLIALADVMPRLGRLAVGAGLAACAVSLTQAVLGVVLVAGPVRSGRPTTAETLFDLLNRLDGVKMLLLAVVAAAVLAGRPAFVAAPWRRVLAIALVVSLVVSAVGYLAASDALAAAAWVSLPLLLACVTTTGVALARSEAARGV